MISHHGYKRISVSKIKATGDIQSIRKEQHTIELGQSLGSTGGRPADPIIVEYSTGKLLGGKHRFAAALNCGLKEVDALLLEGTPEELEQACLVEQIRRRRPTDAEVARLLELEHPTPAQTFPDIEEDEPEPAPKPTTKKEAIAKVAALTGRTPGAVKQAEHRARKAEKAEQEDAPDDGNPCPASCIDTMGLHIPAEVHADAYIEHVFLDGIRQAIIRMEGECTRHLVQYPQLYQAMHEVAAIAKSQTPRSVCPHCKLTKLKAGCLACRGRGWLRADEMLSIPPPLLATGDKAGVYVNGKWHLLKDAQR